MDIVKGFFKGEYATDVEIKESTSLRDDLWLDFLGLEELGEYLGEQYEGLKVDWDKIETIGEVLKLLPNKTTSSYNSNNSSSITSTNNTDDLNLNSSSSLGGDNNNLITSTPHVGNISIISLPLLSPEEVKKVFPPVIDRFLCPRQQDASQSIAMLCFYHAGGSVANMRSFAQQLDKVTRQVAITPHWAELPGHGTRAKEKLCPDATLCAREAAIAFANGPLKRDRGKKFFIFGHSVGTLCAYESCRYLERMGFEACGLVVLNRQAPQIEMGGEEARGRDNFTQGVTDEQFVVKMSEEYGQQSLLQMWKQHPEVVKAGLPVSRSDMDMLVSYRLRNDDGHDTTKVSCPIVCVASQVDRWSNSQPNVAAWKEVTRREFFFTVCKGNHFCYTEQPQLIMPWIGEQLEKLSKK